jgi:hypothetical protein
MKAAVKEAQAEYIEKKKVEAKRLGIDYDPRSEPLWIDKDPNSSEEFLNLAIPQVIEIVKSLDPNKDKASYSTFQKLAKDNGAIGTSRITSEFGLANGGEAAPSISVIEDGKESFSDQASGELYDYSAKGYKTIEGSSLRVADDTLIEPFMLENGRIDSERKDGAFPALVPYSVAEQALGLSSLPDTASPEDKIERIRQVRADIADQTVTLCYRNHASVQEMQEAITQQKEIESNKDNREYIKPDVIYGSPKKACGPVEVISDTRTYSQKLIDTKQLEFDTIFGKEAPESKLVTLAVVGLLPDQADMYSDGLSGLLSAVVSTSVGSGWIVPSSVADDPALEGFVADINGSDPSSVSYIAEFDSLDSLQTFNKAQSCEPDYFAEQADPCEGQGNSLVFETFGNNAAAIKEFETGFYKVFNVVLLIVAALAGLIVMGTIARIISDSRRETAVFRAIGSTRIDMAIVYGLYALIIATFVFASAMIIGIGIAAIVSAQYSPQVTPSAMVLFNVTDNDAAFSFLGINQLRLMQVGGIIYLATLFGLFFPLTSNLRRSPLNDMRDEN